MWYFPFADCSIAFNNLHWNNLGLLCLCSTRSTEDGCCYKSHSSVFKQGLVTKEFSLDICAGCCVHSSRRHCSLKQERDAFLASWFQQHSPTEVLGFILWKEHKKPWQCTILPLLHAAWSQSLPLKDQKTFTNYSWWYSAEWVSRVEK